jgi:hypothetical protein
VDSCQLPVLSGRNRPEIIGKNPKIFRLEYCCHKITGITRNRQFPDRVVRPGFISAIPSNEDDSDGCMSLQLTTNDERRTSTVLDKRQQLAKCIKCIIKLQINCTYRSILSYLFKTCVFLKQISSAFLHS